MPGETNTVCRRSPPSLEYFSEVKCFLSVEVWETSQGYPPLPPSVWPSPLWSWALTFSALLVAVEWELVSNGNWTSRFLLPLGWSPCIKQWGDPTGSPSTAVKATVPGARLPGFFSSVLPHMSCVTSNPSVPQFPYLLNENNNALYLIRLLWALSESVCVKQPWQCQSVVVQRSGGVSPECVPLACRLFWTEIKAQ